MRLLRNVNQVVEEFRVRLQTLLETVNHIRSKVDSLSNIISLITDGAGGLAKKIITKKAHDWLDDSSEKFNNSAKEAVAKAVEETAKKMKKTAKSIKR